VHDETTATSVRGYGADHESPFGYASHHVQLAIPPGSEPACREFYVGVLGMTEIAKPPRLAARGGLWVRADGIELHLGAEDGFRPARKAHPGISVPDLDGLARRLGARDIPVTWDSGFPGHRRFYVHDNVGNRLEFLQPAAG
jgi:catechol 2,3-dioxygenase-like lactoylglutathione lyase family enzyme